MRQITISLACYAVLFLFSTIYTPPAQQEILVDIPIPEVQVEVNEPVIEVRAIEEEKSGVVIPLVRISAYNPVPRQTDGDPNISSCGPNLERQIAVSQDLFFDEYGIKHLCGTPVTVITDRGETFEDYVIWDTMNPRYTSTADILIPSTDEALAYSFGISPGILILHVD
jgi:hypothetical protein